MIDLTTLTDADLTGLRIAVLTEQERRQAIDAAAMVAEITTRAEQAATERTVWEPSETA